jgi:predicted dehydrogenase
MSHLSRRQFLASSAVGVAGTALVGHALRAADANDRLNLGFIGVGTMGRGHLNSCLGMKDVQVVAVCDVVAERRDDAKKRVDDRNSKQLGKETKDCQAFSDFRKLLDLKGLDAVVIATPDHWHTLACISSARAGKHIYCEKPLTHCVAEGRKLVQEVAKAGITFQVGSQQRTEFGGKFRLAAELVRNGYLGKIKTVRIGVGGPAVPCDLPAQEAPAGTDFDFWLGPAPLRAYNDILCPRGIHSHFPAWRNYREYGGGGLADMGAHHFDIAQWALDMDQSGPTRIEPPAKGATGLKYTYANGIEMFHGGPADCTFEGSKGILKVSRDKIDSDPADLLKTVFAGTDVRLGTATDHRRDWIAAIRAKRQPTCTAEIGHRTATICHLGNIGYQLRRNLTWDPAQEKFVGDDEANQLLAHAGRGEWKL